jgi:hypothetical protein
MNDVTTEFVRRHYSRGPTAYNEDGSIVRMPTAEDIAYCEQQFDAWLAEHDAALVAERDEAIRQRDEWASRMMERATIEQERDAAREQLAAVASEIRGFIDSLDEHVIPDPDVRESLAAALGDLLSGYPVSSAHTEPTSRPRRWSEAETAERDAEKWAEGWDARGRLRMHHKLEDLANPYRVTPTETTATPVNPKGTTS